MNDPGKTRGGKCLTCTNAQGGDAAIPLKARGQGFGPTGEVAR